MKLFLTMPQTEVTKTFFTDRAMAKVRKLGEVTCNPYDRQLSADEIAEMAGDADVILSGWGTAQLTKEQFDKMPNMKLIAYTGGSAAGVTDRTAVECGVRVLSGNNVFAKSVAEGCLCYTVSALREIEYYQNLVRKGGWREEEFHNRGLIGKKVGIVGFGTIARFYVELLQWFNCEILIYSSHMTHEEAAKYNARTASLEEIFSECEIVSLHSSLTDKTRGMITRELMMKMKPDTLFVNTARGALVDEEALFDLIVEKRFYAALDAFIEEPFAADHPVRKADNALLIPHMGGPTIDMREVVVLELVKDIIRWSKGEPMEHEVGLEQMSRMSKN